ncbi:bifunctional nuclease domain-containing protein [Prevotella sp. OH937_COT-195]|uniref:bifunctional nuclease domain-containing protein n=1 Tax=Prevotella sp. OH937_COT-195 TaxID=2491051 RepID=UPI000F64FD91|nr:bifunctional nuclease domain-containing protein [Prevotella sp. OH937_COT-195]RRD01904.1 bifunctional nuclease [Prevotella sp. OH937_COT-195]
MYKGIRLRFVSVSEIVGSDDLALIILADEQRERQISIVCGRDMAVQLDMRVRKIPVTQRMLPEVLSSIISDRMHLCFYMLINGISDGQYDSVIVNDDTNDVIPIRVSDAVLLSVASDIPLYIDERLMRQQSVMYRNPSVEMKIPLPMNAMSIEMLDKAIERAINEENYEQASLLTEERNRRTSGLGK